MKINKSLERLILILFFILVLIWFLWTSKEGFEQLHPEAQKIQRQNENPESADRGSQCSPSGTLGDIAYNYIPCCEIEKINNQCYCDHPITQTCIKDYRDCLAKFRANPDYSRWISNTEIYKHCKDALKSCGDKFSTVDVNQFNFVENTIAMQNDDPIQQLNVKCSLGRKPTNATECKKLCVTMPECKAYIVDQNECTIFKDFKRRSELIPAIARFRDLPSVEDDKEKNHNPLKIQIKTLPTDPSIS
jgi:hypothetical protein